MIIKTAPLGNLSANFYLIADEKSKEMIAVDPGDMPELAIDLTKKVDAKLKYIVLTHAHADHIGALDALKKEFGALVVIHKEDSKALNDSFLNLSDILNTVSPDTKADILVSDGDTLSLGDKTVKFIHTPGHTRGSMCMLADNCLFSGDTIFFASIGRTDFPGGSFEDISASIKGKIYTLPPDTTIYPGHGNPTTVEYELYNNPFVRGK